MQKAKHKPETIHTNANGTFDDPHAKNFVNQPGRKYEKPEL